MNTLEYVIIIFLNKKKFLDLFSTWVVSHYNVKKISEYFT